MSVLHQGDRLGIYTLERELGRGMSASTWLAHRDPEGTPDTGDTGDTNDTGVVLKVLDLSDAPVWSAVDLFRREAEALKALDHPGIPRYLDYFEAPEGERLRLVLAMRHIEGRNLEEISRSGERLPESRIEAILAGLCDILSYLGSLRPPMVHRDVNPRNVILEPDGGVALVDFSGVQDAVRSALHPGATLVGTAGYTPLEQVAGKATTRSDLYGAATTAVFLLTGRNPAELPTKGLKLDLTGIIDLSPRLDAVLGSWLDPDAARRNLSASEAAAILRGESGIPSGDPLPEKHEASFRAPQLPTDSRVSIEHGDTGVRIVIPPAKFGGGTTSGAAFSLVWLGFVAFWTFMALRMRGAMMFPLFSIPFWGVGVYMVKTMIAPAITTTEIILNGEGMIYRRTVFGRTNTDVWPLSDLGGLRLENSPVTMNGKKTRELRLETGTRTLKLGAGLSEAELRFLEETLRIELKALKS